MLKFFFVDDDLIVFVVVDEVNYVNIGFFEFGKFKVLNCVF